MRGAKRLPDFDWRGKIAVVRADLNAPLSANGAITDDSRLVAALPTIRFVLQNGGGVALLSHLGRPTEGNIRSQIVARADRRMAAGESRSAVSIHRIRIR